MLTSPLAGACLTCLACLLAMDVFRAISNKAGTVAEVSVVTAAVITMASGSTPSSSARASRTASKAEASLMKASGSLTSRISLPVTDSGSFSAISSASSSDTFGLPTTGGKPRLEAFKVSLPPALLYAMVAAADCSCGEAPAAFAAATATSAACSALAPCFLATSEAATAAAATCSVAVAPAAFAASRAAFATSVTSVAEFTAASRAAAAV
mmetsp:Transcript_78277/g.159122  ORF Transcript_78277/g.159122 Transcript_78277/m.159122 type:complete len:211 (-) Transcript_78277:3222-3854(-)